MSRSIILIAFFAGILNSLSAQNPEILPESEYPYWPSYHYLDLVDLDTIEAQQWINEDHVIDGWDWSLPEFVEPSPRSLVGLQRNIGWDKNFIPLNLQFKSNSIGIHWVKWCDIEPLMGNYDFSPVISRINQSNIVGSDIILRILCHSKSRGTDDKALRRVEAPLWLEDLGINLLPQVEPQHNLNFDPSHPELKTATFFVPEIKSNSLENNFDFTLEAGENTDSIVVSFVRVIFADVSSEPVGIDQKPYLPDPNIRIVYNSAYRQITIKSTTELKQINVYNISGVIIKSMGCSGNTSTISTIGFIPGIYVVNANDTNGNRIRIKIAIV